MIVSRREFSRLGALGLAAQAFPVARAEAQAQRRIGYCVIGLGRIADHFMRGVTQSSASKITGVVSGHRDKAERIAAQYGVSASSIYSYEDMDRMHDNKAIDAVYVPLPNNMHAEYTIRSLWTDLWIDGGRSRSDSLSPFRDSIHAAYTCVHVFPDGDHCVEETIRQHS